MWKGNDLHGSIDVLDHATVTMVDIPAPFWGFLCFLARIGDPFLSPIFFVRVRGGGQIVAFVSLW